MNRRKPGKTTKIVLNNCNIVNFNSRLVFFFFDFLTKYFMKRIKKTTGNSVATEALQYAGGESLMYAVTCTCKRCYLLDKRNDSFGTFRSYRVRESQVRGVKSCLPTDLFATLVQKGSFDYPLLHWTYPPPPPLDYCRVIV